MSVTYQDSYHVKFSVNVCDTSGKHYHPIFWQCVWQIMWTLSLYHLIFRQCLWHIWIIPFSDNVCDILGQVTLSNFLSMFVTYQDNLIIQFSDKVCDKSGNVCDISGQLPCQRSRWRKTGGKKENNGGNSGELWQLRRCQSTA